MNSRLFNVHSHPSIFFLLPSLLLTDVPPASLLQVPAVHYATQKFRCPITLSTNAWSIKTASTNNSLVPVMLKHISELLSRPLDLDIKTTLELVPLIPFRRLHRPHYYLLLFPFLFPGHDPRNLELTGITNSWNSIPCSFICCNSQLSFKCDQRGKHGSEIPVRTILIDPSKKEEILLCSSMLLKGRCDPYEIQVQPFQKRARMRDPPNPNQSPQPVFAQAPERLWRWTGVSMRSRRVRYSPSSAVAFTLP
jgi:hypothetical protein